MRIVVQLGSLKRKQESNGQSNLLSEIFRAVPKPEDLVLARHPSEVLCVILARELQREVSDIYSMPFAVLGLVSCCKYRATLLFWSQIHGRVVKGEIQFHSAQSAVLCVVPVTFPLHHSVMQ